LGEKKNTKLGQGIASERPSFFFFFRFFFVFLLFGERATKKKRKKKLKNQRKLKKKTKEKILFWLVIAKGLGASFVFRLSLFFVSFCFLFFVS
jgi:hypothetical protein